MNPLCRKALELAETFFDGPFLEDEGRNVRDLEFYNNGCDAPTRKRAILVLPRRVLRRLLRPFFQRQVDLYRELHERIDLIEHALRDIRERQDRLAAETFAGVALGWDHVALSRRLACLEDAVESLTMPTIDSEESSRPAIPFPSTENEARAEAS
ncbi:MAG: hypothetical protein NVSMB14_13870 [Isosphaeraceae bacterium]